jgi:hypothetical protein
MEMPKHQLTWQRAILRKKISQRPAKAKKTAHVPILKSGVKAAGLACRAFEDVSTTRNRFVAMAHTHKCVKRSIATDVP